MSFSFKSLHIPDVILIEPQSFSDDRGFFFESFKESEFASNGIDIKFVQDNACPRHILPRVRKHREYYRFA